MDMLFNSLTMKVKEARTGARESLKFLILRLRFMV